MAEGARLESVYTATYRGFEPLSHRHIQRRARMQMRAFFSHITPSREWVRILDGVRQNGRTAVLYRLRRPAGRAPWTARVSPSLTTTFKEEPACKCGLFFACRLWAHATLFLSLIFFRQRRHRAAVVNQMTNGKDRVPDQHPWPSPAHYLLHLFPLCGLITMDGAMLAGRFFLAIGAAIQPFGRIVEQLLIMPRRGIC